LFLEGKGSTIIVKLLYIWISFRIEASSPVNLWTIRLWQFWWEQVERRTVPRFTHFALLFTIFFTYKHLNSNILPICSNTITLRDVQSICYDVIKF